jgi:hypothetical protein
MLVLQAFNHNNDTTGDCTLNAGNWVTAQNANDMRSDIPQRHTLQ